MPGVEFTHPPVDLLSDALRVVAEHAAAIPTGQHGGVVMVATNVGMNAAVVHRVGETFQVGAWVGKNWGTAILSSGGFVKATW